MILYHQFLLNPMTFYSKNVWTYHKFAYICIGIVMNKRVGDKVSKGETIAYIHASSEESAKEAGERLKKSITISQTEVAHKPLILGKVE